MSVLAINPHAAPVGPVQVGDLVSAKGARRQSFDELLAVFSAPRQKAGETPRQKNAREKFGKSAFTMDANYRSSWHIVGGMRPYTVDCIQHEKDYFPKSCDCDAMDYCGHKDAVGCLLARIAPDAVEVVCKPCEGKCWVCGGGKVQIDQDAGGSGKLKRIVCIGYLMGVCDWRH